MKIATPLVGAMAVVAGSVFALTAQAESEHVIITAEQIEWKEGPKSLPKGAESALLYGDPSKEEVFALRLKLPADYTIPPHTHPKPEIVTVLSGSLKVGMGETTDEQSMETLSEGSFFAFEPGMAHYVSTEEGTVLQLNSVGPWDLQYVNKDDDPRS